MAGSAHFDHFRLPNLQAQSPVQRFDTLVGLLQEAQQQGVLTVASQAGNGPKGMDASRLRTVRTRLYLLGYLDHDDQSDKIDPAFTGAVMSFQAEAGLAPDGVVGRKTWQTLQELVGFESVAQVDKWFDGTIVNPAMVRAIKLRLFVLGFNPARQSADDQVLHQALQDFVLVAFLLKLSDQPIGPGLFPATIAVLFDQDRILARIARAWTGNGFEMYRPVNVSVAVAQQRVKAFIVCCARLELWLHGYTVELDGMGTYDRPDHRSYTAVRFPLFHALEGFWQDNGVSGKVAWSKARDITGALFQALLRMQEAGPAFQDVHPSSKLYALLVKEDRHLQEQVWHDIQSLGSRIWDGLKRAWYWFRAMIGRELQRGRRAVAWAKNLARMTYQYAAQAFLVVHQISESLQTTVSALLHRTFPGSDLVSIVVRHDADFDFSVYVNPEANWTEVGTLLTKLHGQSVQFQFGVDIFASLTDALITVVKNVAAAGGWFGLILALVKTRSRVDAMGHVLKKEDAALAAGRGGNG